MNLVDFGTKVETFCTTYPVKLRLICMCVGASRDCVGLTDK